MQERPLPGEEVVEWMVAERIIELLEARLRNRDRLQTERMQRFLGPLKPAVREARMVAIRSSEGTIRQRSSGHPHHRSKH